MDHRSDCWSSSKTVTVHSLQVELGELKGRLTEVISNCDALCKRIGSEGPESLRSSVKPLIAATPTDQTTACVLPSLPLTVEEEEEQSQKQAS